MSLVEITPAPSEPWSRTSLQPRAKGVYICVSICGSHPTNHLLWLHLDYHNSSREAQAMRSHLNIGTQNVSSAPTHRVALPLGSDPARHLNDPWETQTSIIWIPSKPKWAITCFAVFQLICDSKM
ncbi:unnamed protein product [Linum trigynum]|uniref:Uncharacterized protein n=1 Tax=Linum trigynum TaxID=586398 RepID=A0AAV2EV39_9ROSI